MLNELFSGVFSGSGAAELELAPFLACTGVSLLLGLAIAWSYGYRYTYNRSFIQTLVILPAVVQVVIMLVNGNIGAGVAVAGTFSLVRFRSAPGGAREIGNVFLAMAVGLATGMGYLGAAILFTLIICAVSLLLSALQFGSHKPSERMLRITIPENLDYESAFDDLFRRYTLKSEMTGIRTANLGSLYKLCYRVTLKQGISEKAFLDDLRCRNGNLEISCSHLAENTETL